MFDIWEKCYNKTKTYFMKVLTKKLTIYQQNVYFVLVLLTFCFLKSKRKFFLIVWTKTWQNVFFIQMVYWVWPLLVVLQWWSEDLLDLVLHCWKSDSEYLCTLHVLLWIVLFILGFNNISLNFSCKCLWI